MSEKDIEQILAEEGDAAEAGRDLDAQYVRNTYRAKDPSQLYSVRLPVSRLEELRALAKKYDVTPAALARRFITDGLDREAEATSRAAEVRDLDEDRFRLYLAKHVDTDSEHLRVRDRDSADPGAQWLLSALVSELSRDVAERAMHTFLIELKRERRESPVGDDEETDTDPSSQHDSASSAQT